MILFFFFLYIFCDSILAKAADDQEIAMKLKRTQRTRQHFHCIRFEFELQLLIVLLPKNYKTLIKSRIWFRVIFLFGSCWICMRIVTSL